MPPPFFAVRQDPDRPVEQPFGRLREQLTLGPLEDLLAHEGGVEFSARVGERVDGGVGGLEERHARETTATPSMAGLSKSQREQNVRRAFRLANPAAKTALAGKNILLVDDVMTTGATLNSCTHTLLEAGAHSVSALVFARVV